MSLSYVVRNATKDDLPAITAIIYDSDFKWFGNKRPKYTANRTLFTIYQTHRLVLLDPNASDKMIAYAEFRNYPNISAMASDSWLEWLQTRYCLTDDISSMNCLFFNFCIYSNSHPDAIAEAARALFYRENTVRFLIAIKVSDRDDSSFYTETYTDLAKYAEGFYPHEFNMSTNTNMQSLFIIKRDSLMTKITFRKALPEDNDDIFEMHEYEYPEVRDQVGPYYIAEELLRQEEKAESNILIVAEFEESQLAGFLWLETDVDNFHLVRNYDLDIFGNLIKFNSKKPYSFRTEIVNSVERKSEAHLFTVDAMEDLEGNTILGGLQCSDSNISVAGWTKLRVSSINDNTGDSFNKQNKFYLRESIYRKFLFIFEKMIRIKYYISQHVEQINLFYNTDKQYQNPDECIRNSTNVFVLRYICAEKHFPLERLHTFLCAMFSAFPDRDYCIMSIPKSSGKLRSPLEALKYFMPVAQRPTNVSNLEDIYITHRSSIYGELSLYRLHVGDVQTILSLAMDSSRHGGDDTTRSSFSYNSKVDSHVHSRNEISVIEQIMQDVLQNKDSEFDVFTIRCGNSSRPAKENTTIGYVILRRFLHHAELQFNYHLPQHDHLRSQRAEIISLKLHPLFNNTCDIILRTLAATTKYYDFYFIEGRKNVFSNDLKTMMMMLEPKQVKKYNFDKAEMGRHHKAVIDGLPRHNFRKDLLVIFRHKLKPSRWFGNTNRLVIIGFTGLTKAILRQLVFMWNSTDHENSENYTCLSRLQVTVISGPGIVEAEYDKMFKCPNCSSPQKCYMYHDNSSCYLRDVVRRMDLRYWVHFISGTVNYINRDKKFVKVNDSCEIFYDNLILSNSLRFCLQRCKLGELRTPCNFIEINNRIDKFLLFYKMRVLNEEQKHNYRIIMHGFNLDTYECISFLLSHGVAASHLVLVIPRCPVGTSLEQKMTKSDFDRNLQYVIDDMLTDLGVAIHRDLDFQHWIQHGTTQFIIEVVFAGLNTVESMKRFDCDLFISFVQGHMDYFTMRWLSRSGISMDCNTILVNQEFRTNDPDIYAVGSFVKITTPINYQHTYTSAQETAAKLLHFMGLRPYGAKFEYRYSKPSYFHALLPLGYNITKVTMPRRFLASYVLPCIACPLTTYHEDNFCRIVLSPKQMVEEIVLVSKNIDYYDYLSCFCGKHEAMLNNLSQRYQDGQIPCLMKFLQEPWAELIMHEQFQDFQEANHKLLKPMFLSTETNKNLTSEEFGDVNKHILEHNLINFLRIHQNEFHHKYALPENFSPYNMRSTMTMHALKEYKLGTEDRKFTSMASEDSYVIRSAGIHDLDQIEVLFLSSSTRQVGDKKEQLTHLFDEYRSHRMVVHLKDDPNRVLAYSEFSIHPNIAVLSNELWIQWLKCRFCLDVPVTLMNTMFLTFYIYNLKHEKILKQVLTEVYYREHKLLFLIVTRPPKYEPKDYEPFEKLGTPYYPIDYDIEKGKDLPTLIIFKRDQLIPLVTFRRALPEDNDDVVEMIDVDMPEMRKQHGDFFIAELLLGTSGGSVDNDKIIVTEDPTTGGSSGMMWLSDDIDLEMMVTKFDLESFGNLVRYTPNVPHHSVEFEVYATEYTHYTLDRRVYHFNQRTTFNTETIRLQAAFKYIDNELRRGSTYLRKAVKMLKISFDAPQRRSHHRHSHGPEKVNLQRACKAFILKNFLLHPSLRLEYTFYYLCAMFSAYPELDYCIVRVPLGSKMSASLCALLQYFTRVPHRPKALVSDEMFVAHRTSINTDIDIFPFEKDDLNDMLELLQQRPRISLFVPSIESMVVEEEISYDEATRDLIQIIEEIADDVLYNEKSEFNMFIIRAGCAGRDNSTTVGFVILRPFADYGTVYKQFMLPYDQDNFTFERGELIMLRLHPYFLMWSDAILRTVSLRTGYRDLYYFQPFLKTVLPNDLVSRMMPVEPRRMRRNWFIEPSSHAWINRSSKEASLPPVNYMTDFFYLFRHNLHQSKNFGSHTRLVILGFSDICKALLRLMIFGWNTPDFKNVNSLNCLPWLDVTVILKYGEIEAEYNHDKICIYCSKDDNCYLDSDHCCPFVMDATKRIDLRKWVHFVPGVVKTINRTEKTVQLENNCKISYEKLLLLCDTNYGLQREIEEKLNITNFNQPPCNYISLNSRLDKMLLYFKIHELLSSPLNKKSIVVFGCTLTVYECINFLLMHNCKPEDITLVQPHKICKLKFETNPTEDTNIEGIMTQMVSDLGIRVYESCQLEGFVLDQNFYIQVANFVYYSRQHSLSLHCKLFINFQELYMPSGTERVLQKCGIDIRDRQIRVDHTFCTNDPNIYAAGKNVIIKDQVFYQYNQTSELEMAEKLMDIMQLSLEPYTKEKRFSRPKMFHARFPKGFMFIKVTMPKRYMLGKMDNTFCHTMTTYQNSEFCRVSLGTTWILNEITCVIRYPKRDFFFLEYFVGKHETLLNNLHGQFKNGYIDNFIKFFQDPWTEFIMHDRFPEMQSKNRDTLIALLQQRQGGKKAMNIGDADFKITCKHFVEANLLKFLRAYRREFVNEFALPEDWQGI